LSKSLRRLKINLSLAQTQDSLSSRNGSQRTKTQRFSKLKMYFP
jgi:hypothetical protein